MGACVVPDMPKTALCISKSPRLPENTGRISSTAMCCKWVCLPQCVQAMKCNFYYSNHDEMCSYMQKHFFPCDRDDYILLHFLQVRRTTEHIENHLDKRLHRAHVFGSQGDTRTTRTCTTYSFLFRALTTHPTGTPRLARQCGHSRCACEAASVATRARRGMSQRTADQCTSPSSPSRTPGKHITENSVTVMQMAVHQTLLHYQCSFVYNLPPLY